MTAISRPFGVTFLAIVLMIGGVLDVIAAGLFLLERNDASVQAQAGSTADEIAFLSIFSMIVGVIVIALALALRNGSNFARYVIAFVAVIRVVALLFVVATYAKIHWYDYFVPALIYSLVAGYLLFDKDSQAYFERPAGTTSTVA